VLSGLRTQDYGAGSVLKQYQQSVFDRTGHAAPAPGLIRLYSGQVMPEWIDYNGHMTEHRYLQCFGEATDALLRHIGVDRAYLDSGRSFYTVETHIMHLGQGHLGDVLAVETQILDADTKRVRLFHSLKAQDNKVIATAEQMLLHVDTGAERASPMDVGVLATVKNLLETRASMPRPATAGRSIGMAKS
jgi:carnitine 3-dehydrogenase